ncbi:MAG: hypothetical protein J6U96_04340, partial [Elusimicrobiaceae bacterium]|nr:hypothetical protein [Elusimicrobiaceae bacterium]
MVVSDKYYPEYVSSDFKRKYTFRLSDGLPVAVADALGTLFTEVDVNEYKYRQHYDYIAELDYAVKVHFGPMKYTETNVLSPDIIWEPILFTTLKVTLRNPKTGYAVARYVHESHEIIPNVNTDWGLWFGSLATILTLGLFIPAQTQLMGMKLRRTLEKGIEKALYYDIMPEMQEDSVNFIEGKESETTNTRLDGKFIP